MTAHSFVYIPENTFHNHLGDLDENHENRDDEAKDSSPSANQICFRFPKVGKRSKNL